MFNHNLLKLKTTLLALYSSCKTGTPSLCGINEENGTNGREWSALGAEKTQHFW